MTAATIYMVQPPDQAPPPPDSPHRQLLQTHLRTVWRFVRMLGCDPDAADDLTQETFVVALQKGLGDRAPHEVAAFLRRTARHLWLREHERTNRRARLLAAAAETVFRPAAGDDDSRTGDQRVHALRACIRELGDRSRQLIRWFYGEGQSRAEIAARLGLQENGVKTALQRTRATLRECLGRKI